MSQNDPLDLRGQEKAQREHALNQKLAQQSEEADLRWLMGSKRGRRMVWRLLDRAGVFRVSFSTNAMQMAFAEGNKNEGLRTLGLIHASCPELYPTMLKEQVDERRNHDDDRRNSQ